MYTIGTHARTHAPRSEHLPRPAITATARLHRSNYSAKYGAVQTPSLCRGGGDSLRARLPEWGADVPAPWPTAIRHSGAESMYRGRVKRLVTSRQVPGGGGGGYGGGRCLPFTCPACSTRAANKWSVCVVVWRGAGRRGARMPPHVGAAIVQGPRVGTRRPLRSVCLEFFA